MEVFSCSSWLKKHESLTKSILIILLGQLISFLLSITSFSSSYLANRGVNAPITQSFFAYFGLTSIYGCIMLFRRKKLLVPWYYYVPLAFVDVQGNYLVTKAFQFTSITSVTLLDCWTIPWVIILTWVFIGTRYSICQYIGAATCIVGLALVLFSDAGVGGGGGSKPLLGDFLVIAGTLFYAITNVGEEFCVKRKDLVEVIAMIGLFGLVFSTCQIALLERHHLEAVEWSTDVILGFAGYAAAACSFYTLVPFLLKLSGATLLNLSLLTSDMWAVLVRILFYHEKVDWLYYVSFVIVVVGLVIYSKRKFSFRRNFNIHYCGSSFSKLLRFWGIYASRSEMNPSPLEEINVDGYPAVQYQALNEETSELRDDGGVV